MRRSPLPILLLFASFAVATSADHDFGVDARGVLTAIAKAPVKTRNWKNPYDGQPDGIAAGEKLFKQHCTECHGEDARGVGHAADLRSSGVQNATSGELAWLLWNGNLAHGMPSWSGLPEQRRWQIVSYLKNLGPVASSNVAPDSSSAHSAVEGAQ